MATEFTTVSGAKIVINPASFKDAKVLKKAIQREMIGQNGLDLNAVLTVDSSDAVDAALWPCLARCLRNDEKIIESTFDGLEARKDYYEVAIACARENLGPLAEGLFSKLQEFGIIKTVKPDIQKSA